MNDAVRQGFIQKCAELGINPDVMGKYAGLKEMAGRAASELTAPIRSAVKGVQNAGTALGKATAGIPGPSRWPGAGAVKALAKHPAAYGPLGFAIKEKMQKKPAPKAESGSKKEGSLAMEGFLDKCAELGINPIVMTKYAQIDWNAIGEQAKGLGTKALDFAKANPEAVGAGVGALTGGLGGALMGGKGNRMLGGALGAVGGGALGYGAGKGYHMYEDQQAAIAAQQKAEAQALIDQHLREGQREMARVRLEKIRQQEAAEKAQAQREDAALTEQARGSTVGGLGKATVAKATAPVVSAYNAATSKAMSSAKKTAVVVSEALCE